jgi:ubiquinone/menaquinone biosynthesis C-methylase UbiE
MRRWWLDEQAHAGPEHLDAGYVAGYDRKAGFDPTEDIEVLRGHGLGPDSLVIDLGAGTGTFAVSVAPSCRRVVAVDVSAVMTAALRTRIERLGLDNVTVVDAGFLSYIHEGEPVDIVFTRNALHQVPDFWNGIALDRIASFLRPHGVLRLRDLVFDFAPHEAEERIEAWMSGAVSDPAAGWTADELVQHVRTECSTYSWLLDSMLERTGFDILERTFRRSAYGTYTCRRRGS